MARDKNWALNQLRHQRNAFFLTLAAMRLLNSEQINALAGRTVLLKGNDMIFDPISSDQEGERFELGFDQIIATASDDVENFQADLFELFKFTRRNLVKEGFETVKAYAKSAQIEQDFTVQSWYPFAYVVRNAISHDLRWDFQPSARRKLPTTWHGFTISDALQGQEFNNDVLNPKRTIELIISMKDFVETH